MTDQRATTRVTGVLIAESLRLGGELAAVPLRVTRIRRTAIEEPAPEQPGQWTLLDFEADAADAAALAEALAAALSPVGGWYCDFHSGTESFVVFPGRVFRYPRGDAAGRAAAQAHGRILGIPGAQLDWTA